MIVKAASEALVVPLLTLICTFGSVPTSPLVGVHASCPVAMLKVAHAGLFSTLKLSAPLPEIFAVGVNE
ncbi:MAG: hypothetical protein ACREU3_05315 [Steroidobacteraceae bacterium]